MDKRKGKKAGTRKKTGKKRTPDKERTPDEIPVAERLLRGQVWLVLAVLVIIAAMVAPLAYRNWQAAHTLEKNKYNGFDFVKESRGDLTLWVTQLDVRGQVYNIPFYHHPREAESVIMEPGVTDRFLGSQRPALIYITVPADGGSHPVVGGVEISRITGFKYGLLDIETKSALQEAVPDVQTPVITCADATNSTAVLSFEQGATNLIVRDKTRPDCIRFIYKDENSSILVADRFAYGLLRIMPG